ncbi:MAG: aconitase X, partial [Sphaerochaetaceae bacterium]
MYEPKMKLTKEQQAILTGEQGPVMAQVMETIVMFGDMFGAKRLVKVTHNHGHLVTSFGLGLLKPLYATMDKLVDAKVKVKGDFTIDPRPMDFRNVPYSILDKLINSKILYTGQKRYEQQLKAVGIKDDNAFTCACYLPEVGNVPKKGDILSWAESSAVVFANSVLGARCNRNSGMLDLFGSILGYVPEFGFLTDEGRKASWKVIVKTTRKPEAQILGSAIGMKAVEDVPYIIGLDKWIGDSLTDEAMSYLKDFGAATASNGAVGLYHVENLTPEAVEMGPALLKEDCKEYVIDDKELERVYRSYPVMWPDKDAKPSLCFIGCPHLSFEQLNRWTEDIEAALAKNGRSKIAIRTVLTTAPDVAEKFRKTTMHDRLIATGATLACICPLMYTSNPLTKKRPIMTSSNKLRTYS